MLWSVWKCVQPWVSLGILTILICRDTKVAGSTTPPTPTPSTPVLGTVVESAGGIQVTWTAVTGVVSQYVVSAQPAQGVVITKTVNSPELSTTLSENLVKGQTYVVSVKAVSNGASSPASQTKTITLTPSTPVLGTVVESAGGIQVTWTAVTGVVSQYVVSAQPTQGAPITKTVNSPPELSTTLSENLLKGQTYVVSVKAVSNGASSPASQTKTITLTPSTPVLGTVVESAGGIQVTWTAVTGVVSQYVVSAQPAQGALITKTVNSPELSTTLSENLVKGQTYVVSVKAVSNGVSSPASQTKTITLTPSTPVLGTVVESTGGIQVTWTAVTGVVSQYVVSAQPTQGAPITKTVNSPPELSTTLSENLLKGQTYVVSVKAVSNGASSPASQTKTITLTPSTPVLGTVGESAGGIQVTWTAVTGVVSQYVVSAQPAQGALITKTVNSPPELSTTLSENLVKGQTYVVRVKAVSNGVSSPASQTKTITLTPSTPVLGTVVESAGGIQVTWTAVTGVVSQYVVSAQPTQGAPITKTVNSPPELSTTLSENLLKGQTYVVSVKAVSNGASSPASQTKTITLTPSTPVLGTVLESAGGIQVTWTAVTGVVSQYVVSAQPAQGALITKTVNSPPELSTTLSENLVKGQTYVVSVKAVSNGASSPSSQTKTITLTPSTPVLGTVLESAGGIQVTWTAVTGVVSQYVVSAQPAQGALITKTVNSPELSTTLSENLVKGQTYVVSVKAVSNGASSLPSQTKTITLTPSTPVLGTVLESAGGIQVTWTAVTGVVSQYVVSAQPAQGALITKTVNSPELSTTLSENLVKGQTYVVSVKAVSNGVSSPASQTKTITLTPSTPVLGTVVESTGGIQVTWTAVTGVVSQYVVSAQPAQGALITKTVNSPPELSTTLSENLVKGQTYVVSVKAVSNGASSPASQTKTITLTPPTPFAVSITAISTSSVTVSVTLLAGRYDGVLVELYTGTGGSAVSSGSSPVSDFTLTSEGQRVFTVTSLTPALTPGQQYTVRVKSRSGSVSSADSPVSVPATVAPSVPVFVKVVPSSGDQTIEVTWRKGPGIVDRFYVMIGNTEGWSLEKSVDFIDESEYRDVFNPPQSGVYNLTLKSQSNTLNSSASQPYRVELPASPVNISVRSKTSRSLEVMWHNDDPSVENYRLVVKDNDDLCIKEVHFTKVGYTASNKKTCEPVIREDFQANQTDFLYNVTGLFPYISYQMVIFLKSEGVPESDNNSATLNRRTETEVPSRINITSTPVDGPENVSVCWTPPVPFPGPTNYTVTVIGLEEVTVESKKQILGGYDQLCTSFGSLEQFWTYQINVHASTTAGVGPSTDSPPFRTSEAAPGKVTSFAISPLPNIYTEVRVSWKAPSPRDRNANITHFNLTYKESTADAKEVSYTIYWSESRDLTYHKRVPVSPERAYNFTVSAESEHHNGDESELTYFAEPGPPKGPTGCVIGCSGNPPTQGTSENSFSVELDINTAFFSDDTNGQVVDVGLVVQAQPGSTQPGSGSSALPKDHFLTFPTWSDANREGFGIAYRPTPQNWLNLAGQAQRRKRQTDATFSYRVGAETNCSLSADEFCNGPVLPGKEYSVKAFSCTAGGCTETKYVGGYRTKEKENYTNVIIGVCVAGGLLIVIVFVVFVGLRRRRNKQKGKNKSGQDPDIETSPTPFIPLVVQNEQDYQKSKPFKLSELFDVVAGMHKDSNLAFSTEYNWLKNLSPKLPVTAAALESNRAKNRYTDILAFDDTRVKLLPVEDDEASDYINANYIPGYHSQREYIAAQGPLKTTVDDFWRMIWEQDVRVIVMLTKVMEKGQRKCEKYWPDDSEGVCQFGDVSVEPVSYSNLNTYVLRELSVSVGSNLRKLKQFHYLMWPDFGVSTCEEMVDFLQAVRSHIRPNMAGPILVHCSAGVGRTGSFIAVDGIREKLYDNSAGADPIIDIYQAVLTMRQHRPRMVQTESQYVFIHDSVCEVAKQKIKQEQTDDEHIYGNEGFDPDQCLYENTNFDANTAIYQNCDVPRTEL